MHASPVDRLRAALTGRYTLERELGRGGMATVWLARDLKHDRLVALKVLRPEIAAALGPARFLREITLTAGLDHPHILALLDSGEAVGFLYYTMPFVEGESLRARLTREKQLPLDDALQITREVADALGYAHSRGIVHRDIKPENILLAGGHARVADFGIATALTAAGGERLTETGIAVGTPAYMSPEQGAGSQDLDGRSDLYSLGCVLYEMLGGETPFLGNTPQAILAKKLSLPAPRVSVVRDTVPASVEAALMRALARAPADRFTTAAQLTAALLLDTQTYARRHQLIRRLRRALVAATVLILVAAGGVSVARSRTASGWRRARLDSTAVAVMPFRVTGTDPAIASLSEGVVDLFYPLLSGGAGLRAVEPNPFLLAWNESRSQGRATGADAPLRLAAHFHAGWLVEGSLAQAGPLMTLNAWLRRVPDGEQVAQYSVTGGVDTVHVLVNQLVMGLLGARLGEDADRLDALRRRAPGAVAAYLAGVRAQRHARYDEAVEAYERALTLDSTFALAALRLFSAHELSSRWPRASYALSRARRYRDQLGPRERAELDFLSVLWNIDTTGMGAATLDAARRWAEAAPDNPDALLEYGGRLLFFGSLLGIPGWQNRTRDAWLRAWRLDSTTPRLVEAQLSWALVAPNVDWARRVAPTFLQVNDSSNETLLGLRWGAAQLVGDSVAARRIARRAALGTAPGALSGALWHVMVASFALALPLESADSVLTSLLANLVNAGDSTTAAMYLTQGGLARGRLNEALRTVASPMGQRWPWGPAMILNWWLGHAGLDSAAARAADDLRHTAALDRRAYGAVCYVRLHQAARGDTVGVRDAAQVLMARYRQDGRPGLCPALVEAFVESHDRGRAGTPALDRFEALLRQGAFPERNQLDEYLGTAGPLVLARLRRQRGQFDLALEAARTHLAAQFYWWYQVPLAKEEGDLALLIGDTASAVRAYTRYLALRTDPDPGPVRQEWEGVTTALALLPRTRP